METIKHFKVSIVTFATMITAEQINWLKRVETLYFRYGIKAVTMDDVARELGISKKTLYQFVSSKEDLVVLIVKSFIELDIERTNKIHEESEDAIDEMLQIIDATVEDLQKMGENIIYEMQRYYRKAWDLMFEHQRDFVMNCVKENLERGIKEGLFRKDLNVELVARLHMAQAFTLFEPQWFPAGKFKIDQILSEYFMLYLFGLVTQKGRKELRKKLETRGKRFQPNNL